MDKKNKKTKDISEEEKTIKSDSGENEVEELKTKIEELEKESQENLLGWQRAKADFVNYKQSQEKSFADFKSFATEDVILKLLPTIDSFELAAKYMPKELENSDWAKGMISIKGLFDNFLKEVEIIEIEAVGKEFDPNLHEAVLEEESEEEEGIVIEEVQRGYFLNDKVIRPSKVKVSKGKNKI